MNGGRGKGLIRLSGIWIRLFNQIPDEAATHRTTAAVQREPHRPRENRRTLISPRYYRYLVSSR